MIEEKRLTDQDWGSGRINDSKKLKVKKVNGVDILKGNF